jgi:carboxyl-terminal processing protease
MKKRLFQLTAVSCLIIFLISSLSFAEQSKNKEKDFVLSGMNFQTLDYWHFRPAEIDDQLSTKVFNEYLENLDPNQRFFLNSDINRLKQYQYQIDNQISRGSTTFMELANSILEERIQNVQQFIPEILAHPLNLTEMETLENDPKKRGYCKHVENSANK